MKAGTVIETAPPIVVSSGNDTDRRPLFDAIVSAVVPTPVHAGQVSEVNELPFEETVTAPVIVASFASSTD